MFKILERGWMKKMIIDVQSKISEYLELIEAIREEVDDPLAAMTILQELRKDMRSEEIRQNRPYVSTGDLPATEAQIGYVKRLGGDVPEKGMTRSQASKLIDELQKAAAIDKNVY
jgi:hypothetical protein